MTKYQLRQLPSEPYSRKFDFAGSQLFDKKDTAKLRDKKSLTPVGEFLQNNPFGLAVVAALSGMKGDSAGREKLTEARAAVVRDYLVKNYRVDDTRIKTLGMGKNEGAPDGGAVEVMVYPMAVAPRRAAGGR